jgi:hypothetical protein
MFHGAFHCIFVVGRISVVNLGGKLLHYLLSKWGSDENERGQSHKYFHLNLALYLCGVYRWLIVLYYESFSVPFLKNSVPPEIYNRLHPVLTE